MNVKGGMSGVLKEALKDFPSFTVIFRLQVVLLLLFSIFKIKEQILIYKFPNVIWANRVSCLN